MSRARTGDNNDVRGARGKGSPFLVYTAEGTCARAWYGRMERNGMGFCMAGVERGSTPDDRADKMRSAEVGYVRPGARAMVNRNPHRERIIYMVGSSLWVVGHDAQDT